MFGKRKLQAEIVRLTYRVAELEERLCPCEDHDWKEIGKEFVSTAYDCGEYLYTYKCRTCRTCGKTRKSYEF